MMREVGHGAKVLTAKSALPQTMSTQLDIKEGTSTMMAISMDGADPATSDPALHGSLAAPENNAVLYETVDEKAVLSANEKFYEAWRLIVHRHASMTAERPTA
jgi:hypothetical protein